MYPFLLYTPNAFVTRWREWYIETAMGTMTHQWLATWFIPEDIINEVMTKRYLMNQKQEGIVSNWDGAWEEKDTAETPKDKFYAMFSELNESEFESFLADNPEYLENGYDEINIDLIGTWRTDKYAALYMRKQGFGRIINISSTSGMYGTPQLATYCMAKWGVRGLTKTLAQELKGTGIVVNDVCPTKVKTPMGETESYVKFINDLTGKDFKNWQEMYEGVPFLEVEDISDMVYWLGTSRAAGKFSGRDLGLDLGTLQQ